MNKRIVQILSLLLALTLGGYLSYRFFAPKSTAQEDSTILLENIKTVCKLVTVEGEFSEIYNYSEYQGYFTFFWDKKILVRVRAKVSAGFDLNKLKIDADSTLHIIHMNELPEPEIISIEPTLDYYDISNGLFTDFTAEDYNRINKNAVELIRTQALKSSLLPSARKEADKIRELIAFMVDNAGWKLVVDDQKPPIGQ